MRRQVIRFHRTGVRLESLTYDRIFGMDALYFFRHSDHNDLELRYSLRSIAKHMPWIRKVWIFGDRPQFLVDDQHLIEHVPHEYVARVGDYRTPLTNFFLMFHMASLIPGLASEYQDIHPKVRQIEGFQFVDLKELLEQRGVDVTTLDFFDQRADLKFDLNEPVGEEYNETFDMLLDIGSIEHVYDTRQAFTNYLGMVKTGGYICIHTPVSGYFRHGLHTFHPETIRESLRQNGCTVCYEKFTTSSGQILLEADLKNRNALIWIVAQKTSRFEKFVNPQQGRYANAESKPSHSVIGNA